jgi:hypothetical protein
MREYERDPEPLSIEQIDSYRIFFDRLDEQQKRWFAALEANRRGHGGLEAVCRLFDISPNTVRRGRDELAAGLSGRPSDRTRKPGAGRPKAEKKTLKSKTTSPPPSDP